MNEILMANAQAYAAKHKLEIAESLGSGKDGIVLVGKRKARPGDVAIKILHWEESYLREKLAYQRLANENVEKVQEFNVPQCINCDDSLRILEITIVKRPFVLDFAGAFLDFPPEFADETWSLWEEEKREQFEERWPKVQSIIAAFEEWGIFLMDVTPGNIGFLD